MGKTIFRILLIGALLAVAYTFGSYQEKTKQAEISKPTARNASLKTEDTPAVSKEDHSESAVYSPLVSAENEMISLFEEASKSVCFITTTSMRMDFWHRRSVEVPQGSGSGFIWDKQGHIVTNYHVIEGSSNAQVMLSNGKKYDAEVVGSAPEKDLAVLRINAPNSVLQPLQSGNSQNLKVGQIVLAIGNPFGLDQTLTTGIVSALEREIKSRSGVPIRDVIQTDAAINPGNSGGPLLDSRGRLIGVNTAIYSPSGASAGIGFSIPVDAVKWVVPDLIAYGEVRRPLLDGLELVPTYARQRRLGIREGALIMDVKKNSLADKAGLRQTYLDQNGKIILGDLILYVGNEKIIDNSDFILALEEYRTGNQTVDLTILRNGKKEKVEVEMGM